MTVALTVQVVPAAMALAAELARIAATAIVMTAVTEIAMDSAVMIARVVAKAARETALDRKSVV